MNMFRWDAFVANCHKVMTFLRRWNVKLHRFMLLPGLNNVHKAASGNLSSSASWIIFTIFVSLPVVLRITYCICPL